VSLWHTIRGRETMEHFPCVPEGIDVGMNAISYFCSSEEMPECKIADLCPLRPIYEEYEAMRTVVIAELAGATPQGLASRYRTFSMATLLPKWQKGRAIKRADAWEGLAEKLEAIEAE